MYSYTATGIHSIHPPQPNQPKLRVKCKCERTLIQEQIYTCLGCTGYCCHFCTMPQIFSYQCRNCCNSSETTKTNRCKMCFSCPYCSNVLILSRDKEKKYIMLCQFCYWSTKEIDVAEEKTQDLTYALNKLSSSIKESQSKIYNASQGFFKEVLTIVDYERQIYKITNSKKSFKKNQEQSLLDTKKQIQKTCQSLIKRVGLQQNSEQFQGEVKIPQNLPLLAKKIRRCPSCKKPLTTTFRNRNGQQKIQLMFKDVKMIQCQRLPPIDGIVSLKFLRQIIFEDETNFKVNDIKKVEVNKPFKVKIDIVNRTKGTTSQIEYQFIVLID